MSNAEPQYILEIAWRDPDFRWILPELVGPFDERREAFKWAETNIPNGSYKVRSLARPYLRTLA